MYSLLNAGQIAAVHADGYGPVYHRMVLIAQRSTPHAFFVT